MSRPRTPDQVTHLSHSSISTYLRCPRQWAYAYLEGLKKPPAAALIKGKAVDDGLTYNLRQKVKSREDLPVFDVLAMTEESFRKEVDRQGGKSEVDWESATFASALDSAIEMTATHMEEHAPLIQPLHVQYEAHRELEDGRDFVGYFDFITEDGIVGDWKTGKKRMGQSAADSDLQPSAYAFLSEGPITFAFYRAIDTGKSQSSEILITARSEADRAWYGQAAADVSAAIDAGIYPPNPNGWHCSKSFCGYWDLCKANRKPRIG